MYSLRTLSLAWGFSLMLLFSSAPVMPKKITLYCETQQVQSEHQCQLWKRQNLKWIKYNFFPCASKIFPHCIWTLRIAPLYSIRVYNPFQNIPHCTLLALQLTLYCTRARMKTLLGCIYRILGSCSLFLFLPP